MRLLAYLGAATLVALIAMTLGLLLGWLEVQYEKRLGLKRKHKP